MTSQWPRAPTGCCECATAASSRTRSALLATQGLDRREPNRAPGRIDSADHADAECEREPPGENACREVGVEQARGVASARKELGRGIPEPETDRQGEQTNPQRFAHHERRDLPGRPADRAK